MEDILHQLVDGLSRYNPSIYIYLQCFIVTNSYQYFFNSYQ